MGNLTFMDLGPATARNYGRTKYRLVKALKQCNDDDEMEIISEMISDCNYVIEWLRTGKRPGNRRGIERRAAYQREKLMDPLKMQAFVTQSSAGSPSNLTDWQRFQIEDALSRLSPRERECYVLAHGECFSFKEIADMLGISKSSVEEYVERAQSKVTQELATSLFLLVN